MWNWRAKNSRKRNSKSAPTEPQIEHLETRALLAGNVIASLNGSHLVVTGDVAANSVEVTLLNGNVQLRGLDSTTINGSTDAFIIAAGTDTMTGNVQIAMGTSNDSVAFSRDVTFLGSVLVYGEDGNDTIAVTGAIFKSSFVAVGGAGNDTISLQDSTSDNWLVIYGESGDDLVSMTNMTLNGPMKIKGQDGNDGASLNNVTSNSVVKIKMGRGDDDVIINDSTLNGGVHIKTKQDSDAVLLDNSTFGARVHINLGRDNDGLIVRDTNTFNGLFSVQGGDSRLNSAADFPNGDALTIGTGNIFNQGQRIRRTEATTVSATATDRFDAATTGLIARATAADTAAKTLTSLTISATPTAAADNSVTSDGVLITKDANVTISGTTLPGAIVTLDTDDDGVFDNGTITADDQGAYSTVVVVTRKDLYTTDATVNDQLTGLQTINLRSTLNTETADTSVTVDLIKATNALVKFTSTTNTGATQEYFVEMFSDEASGTVTNFLSYSTAGQYENSIIHRSAESSGNPFVIQGGGFTVDNGVIGSVTQAAAIASEFDATRPNSRGTISMAHTGNTNSGTSQWFINLADNPLNVPADANDTTGLRHTVFGRVVGNGMTVVDAIHALTEVNLSTQTGSSALNEVPLRTAFTDFARTLSGTIATTANSTQIVGTGTSFTTELGASLVAGSPRSRIQINGQTFVVASIVDDTHLTVTVAPTTTSSGITARADFNNDDQFVRFSTIAEVLKQT